MNTEKTSLNIAITGIGAPLGQSIARAAMQSKNNYRLFLSDIHDDEKHLFPDAVYTKLDHINAPEYKEHLIAYLNKNKIDLMFWGSEREMIAMCDSIEQLQSETGCRFAISSGKALELGTDKLNTVNLLKQNALPFPDTILLNSSEVTISAFILNNGFPLLLKGKRAGAPFIVKNREQLALFQNYLEDYVIQEFLGDESSQEYTVGVFYTPENGVIDMFCMERQLKYGLTWRGKRIKNPEIEDICTKAITALNPKGSVNVQLRYHKGKPVIHEFNVRCSSTTVFRAMAGWNEVDMAVDYFVKGRLPVPPENIQNGYALRFFEEKWINLG